MGQDSKYIIINKIVDVPINIVHFQEGNCLVFPLLIDDFDFDDISIYSKKSNDNIYTFFDLFLHGPYSIEYPMKNLFHFIMKSNFKHLGIIAFREFMDLEQNVGDSILFLNNRIVEVNGGKEYHSGFKVHELLNSSVSLFEIVNNEDKYYSYEDAEHYYLKNLNL